MSKIKVLAFGASNSHRSINKALATFALGQLEGVEPLVLDLNDYEMPIYSIDRERADGIPAKALEFREQLAAADAFIISFAEHNGAYTAAYKNVYDWVSRIRNSVWDNKPMLLMATSPGGRGGKGVLELAYRVNKFKNPNVVGQFCLPSFGQNFNPEQGILNEELKQEFESLLQLFSTMIHEKTA